MRIFRKTLFLVLAMIVVVSTFVKKEFKAETIGTENIQKIVSVVYDNSGSMNAGEEGKDKQYGRYRYAAYSLQMLAGLLNENDKLVVTPMNEGTSVGWPSDRPSLVFDLSGAKSREEIVSNMFYNPMKGETSDEKIPITTGDGKPNTTIPVGNTPYSTIKKAINAFKQVTDGKGLPTSDQYSDEDKNVEYWLVILTDGIFSEYDPNASANKGFSRDQLKNAVVDEMIADLKDYGHLNTIYYAFGDSNSIFDLKDTDLTEQLSFTAYTANDGESIINNMKDIANKLSKRFALENDFISYDRNKVVIDLNKYSSNAIVFKSLSIVAQDCGDVVKSVKYNGKDISNYIKRPCVLKNQGITGMLAGYLAILEMDEVFNGGIIELEFAKKVSLTGKPHFQDKVHVLVEPALSLEPYFTYYDSKDNTTKEIDMEFVNSTLTSGSKIQANYRIVNPIDGSEITDFSMFGATKSKVNYIGPNIPQGLTYDVGQDISLVVGRNTINLEVVFGEKYTLLSSVSCVVETKPEIYKVSGTVDKSNNQVVFKIFYDNNQKTKDDIKNEGYKIIITVTDPSGKEIVYDDIFNDSKIRIDNDGNIKVDVDVVNQEYGRYEVSCKVVFNETDRIVRTDKQYLLEMPNTIEVKATPETITIGQYGLSSNQKKIVFAVYGDGNLINIDNHLYDFKLEVDGKDRTSKAIVKRTQGTVEFIPNTSNLESDSVGEKEVILTITRKDNNNQIVGKCLLIIEPTRYDVVLLTTEQQNVNIYKLKECDAEVRFKIYRNDISLTKSELLEYYENGTLEIDKNSAGWLSCTPCGVDISFEIVNGETEIVCKVVKDWGSFLWLDSLCASFISTKDKDIKVEYQGVSDKATITFTPVSLGSRIIRWFVLFIYLLIAVHILLYILGFFIRHPFDSGVILNVSISSFAGVDFETTRVNINKKDIIKWHLSRFIPFCELRNQKPIQFGDAGKLKVIGGYPQIEFESETYTTSLSLPQDKNGVKLSTFINQLANEGDADDIEISSNYMSRCFIGRKELVGSDGSSSDDGNTENLPTHADVPRWTTVYVQMEEVYGSKGGKQIVSFVTFIDKLN